MEQSQKIGAGESERCDMGHFTHEIPATLNHKGFSAIANPIE
jgi:hypothetical protein